MSNNSKNERNAFIKGETSGVRIVCDESSGIKKVTKPSTSTGKK
jgi:hypothetical protein